jgi:putative ABC transport system permease protein
MLKRQFLLAWRNIRKRRFYPLLEIFGLVIGIACFVIILLLVRKEINFETFFSDYKKIYSVSFFAGRCLH